MEELMNGIVEKWKIVTNCLLMTGSLRLTPYASRLMPYALRLTPSALHLTPANWRLPTANWPLPTSYALCLNTNKK
jgi:hypothetical protein